MHAIVLNHLSGWQADCQYEELAELLERSIAEGVRIYNLPHWSRPAEVLQQYSEYLINIGYRDPLAHKFRPQFLDGKLRMMDDGVEMIGVAGQSIKCCIPILTGLLQGNSTEEWPTAVEIGWDESQREIVLGKKINTYSIDQVLF